ncbi:hypothetical protein BJ322DRAFT_883865 [Thelephora terrestris]|uniref:Uncharacterized protein n=1 Tax=Thelephora terrestris TaxID=56493 RepID=A0A9P6HBT7_9AGAM|nr:hypothetical protein BJ322DRAFT_883865 [Thelephora terrestris]
MYHAAVAIGIGRRLCLSRCRRLRSPFARHLCRFHPLASPPAPSNLSFQGESAVLREVLTFSLHLDWLVALILIRETVVIHLSLNKLKWCGPFLLNVVHYFTYEACGAVCPPSLSFSSPGRCLCGRSGFPCQDSKPRERFGDRRVVAPHPLTALRLQRFARVRVSIPCLHTAWTGVSRSSTSTLISIPRGRRTSSFSLRLYAQRLAPLSDLAHGFPIQSTLYGAEALGKS